MSGNIYPDPCLGDFFSKEKVLNSWKKTLKLIEKGESPKKFNIYIHIPFCVSKCLFCYSISCTIREDKDEILDKYLDMLDEQIEEYSSVLNSLEATNLYVGGGTPSIMSPIQIKRLLVKLKEKFNITKSTRIIFESSINTLDEGKIDVFKQEGVSEIAFGVQSLDPNVLLKNDRMQDKVKLGMLVNYARKVGIPSITFDMMVGLPYQTEESAINSFKEATELEPNSIYLNSFQPYFYTNFSLRGNVYSEERMKQRDEMEAKVKLLLNNCGYSNIGHAGFRKSWTEEDNKKIYCIQEGTNMLGIGYSSFSHAHGALKYMMYYPLAELKKYIGCGSILNIANIENSFSKRLLPKYKKSEISKKNTQFKYIGLDLDIKHELSVAFCSQFEKEHLREFEKLTGKKIVDVFKSQLRILRILGLVDIKKGKIMFKLDDMVTKKVVSTLFVDTGYINSVLLNDIKEKYDENTDYLSLIREKNSVFTKERFE